MIKVTNSGTISIAGMPEQILTELAMVIKVIHTHLTDIENKEFADKMIADTGKIALASKEEREEMVENLINEIQKIINEKA